MLELKRYNEDKIAFNPKAASYNALVKRFGSNWKLSYGELVEEDLRHKASLLPIEYHTEASKVRGGWISHMDERTVVQEEWKNSGTTWTRNSFFEENGYLIVKNLYNTSLNHLV